jgi:hypothetical protein
MARYDTLLLDVDSWDLSLDANGNIALATPAYSLAQDVASAVKLFAQELWYDTTKGIPYFDDVLGHVPPQPLFIRYLEDAALAVPGVVTAQINFSSFDNRTVSGQIFFIDEVGEENGVTF